MSKAASSTDFDEGLAAYFQFIDELRDSLSTSYNEGRFTARNLKGDVFQPDFSEADNGWILDLAWNCFAKPLSSLSGVREEIATCYQEAFLFHVFYEIDNALIAIDLGGGAAAASIGAANALANALSIESGNENLQQVRREMALQGAIAKHEKTYKKRQQVIEYWREHIPYDTPIERAAEWLKDSFSDIAHRTLCRYVSDAKKVPSHNRLLAHCNACQHPARYASI